MRVVIVLEMFKRDSYRLVGYSRVITNGHVYQDDLTDWFPGESQISVDITLDLFLSQCWNMSWP